MAMLSKLTIRGFKSIKNLENLELKSLNILIGANGAGKSNFISFFKFLNKLINGELQLYTRLEGDADTLLYYGRKQTSNLQAELYFDNSYIFNLKPTKDNHLIFADESGSFFNLGSGHDETLIEKNAIPKTYIASVLKRWQIYHFNDTGDTANVKRINPLNDNERLRPDAENLAAYLYLLKEKHSKHYNMIVETIRLVAPFFDDFHLRPTPANETRIQLEWREKNSDYPFLAHQLSDGTLRFICLATLLLQPSENMPSTIIIDEPELGLHPYAINLLGALIRAASKNHQVIIATQSVELINQFEAEDLIVIDRKNEQSEFHRLKAEELTSWLEEYSLGELWQKNILGGRPA